MKRVIKYFKTFFESVFYKKKHKDECILDILTMKEMSEPLIIL